MKHLYIVLSNRPLPTCTFDKEGKNDGVWSARMALKEGIKPHELQGAADMLLSSMVDNFWTDYLIQYGYVEPDHTDTELRDAHRSYILDLVKEVL